MYDKKYSCFSIVWPPNTLTDKYLYVAGNYWTCLINTEKIWWSYLTHQILVKTSHTTRIHLKLNTKKNSCYMIDVTLYLDNNTMLMRRYIHMLRIQDLLSRKITYKKEEIF